MSDIDTVVADSLKVLDLNGRLEKRTLTGDGAIEALWCFLARLKALIRKTTLE